MRANAVLISCLLTAWAGGGASSPTHRPHSWTWRGGGGGGGRTDPTHRPDCVLTVLDMEGGGGYVCTYVGGGGGG